MDLFEPTSIGTLQLPNRVVRSATAEYLSDGDGRPLPELSAMYCALARGGVGLIITGHAYVHPSGRCRVQMSGMHDDALVSDWAEVVERVHEAGGKIAMQLNHGGRQCDPEAVNGPLLAPSPIALSDELPRPEELSERQIEDLIRAFGDAAGRAKGAGFDAVPGQQLAARCVGRQLPPSGALPGRGRGSCPQCRGQRLSIVHQAGHS
jgi:2,4-dienoyl-CoA reductase-like NADH-dependent reductase (Old Yellow Enzyme family)